MVYSFLYKFIRDEEYSKLTSKESELFSLKFLKYSEKIIEIYFIKNNISESKLIELKNDSKIFQSKAEKAKVLTKELKSLTENTENSELIQSYKEFIDNSIKEIERFLKEYTEERSILFKCFKYILAVVSGYLLNLFLDRIFVSVFFIYMIIILLILYFLDILSNIIRFFLIKNSIKYPKVKQELIYIQQELEDVLKYQEDQLINQKIKSYL